MIHKNMLETIGNSPVIELERVVKKHNIKGEIYAKIEFFCPGLSKKDRIAKHMILQAEKDGSLKPGQTVIEQTSGNTGIGLAAVCAVKGYPFIAVMSEGNSFERIVMIKQFGGKVHLVKQHPDSEKGKVSSADMELVEKEFNRLSEVIIANRVAQVYKGANAMSHYHTTSKEIIKDLPNIDAFCDYVGTGGSFEGIAKGLKEYKKSIQCFQVEPAHAKHIIQGGGYFKTPPFADSKNCDGKIVISDKEALYWAKELSEVEAIAGGISSGANLAAAISYLKKNPGKSIVFLVNDPMLKYMSAPDIQNWDSIK